MKKSGFKTTLLVDHDQRYNIDKFRSKFLQWVQTVAKPGTYTVEVMEALTIEQRGYFHAVIAPHLCNIQAEFGVKMTNLEAKELLKRKFIGTRIMCVSLGDGETHEIKYLPSTESLSKDDYKAFIQSCLDWFIDQFGMPAPEPR